MGQVCPSSALRLTVMKVIALLLIILFGALPVWSQDVFTTAHKIIGPSLVKIHVKGIGKPGEANPEGVGTGFFISPTGHILTARHVIENIREKAVTGSLEYGVQIGNAATNWDVEILPDGEGAVDAAVLKIDSVAQEYAAVCFGKKIPQQASIGDRVGTSGFPKGGGYFALGGVLSSLDAGAGLLGLDIDIAGGQSGSPVYDTFGKVVGIVIGGTRQHDAILPTRSFWSTMVQSFGVLRDCQNPCIGNLVAERLKGEQLLEFYRSEQTGQFQYEVGLLAELGCDLRDFSDGILSDVFGSALYSNDIAIAGNLLRKGMSASLPILGGTFEGRLPLALSLEGHCRNGREDRIQLVFGLISEGADVNGNYFIDGQIKTISGWKPIHNFASNGRCFEPTLGQLLLKKGADINEITINQFGLTTPLELASWDLELEMSEFLLMNGANPNLITSLGRTPFYHIVDSSDFHDHHPASLDRGCVPLSDSAKLFAIFLDYGADPLIHPDGMQTIEERLLDQLDGKQCASTPCYQPDAHNIRMLHRQWCTEYVLSILGK